jgi:hypothetical protein
MIGCKGPANGVDGGRDRGRDGDRGRGRGRGQEQGQGVLTRVQPSSPNASPSYWNSS